MEEDELTAVDISWWFLNFDWKVINESNFDEFCQLIIKFISALYQQIKQFKPNYYLVQDILGGIEQNFSGTSSPIIEKAKKFISNQIQKKLS